MNTDSKIKELEEHISRECGNITGISVNCGGEALYEKYFGDFTENDAFHVFSVTKSIISVLFGVAILRGCIESVDVPVLDFFPEYVPKRGEKTLQKITLRDMLTMTAPYKYKYSPYTKYFTSEDWVKAALDLMGGRGQVGEFRYAPIVGPDILSGVLQRATGKSAASLANEALFEPLGFEPKHSHTFADKDEQLAWYKESCHGAQWIADPQGVNTAGWGLSLTLREMAAIGELYRNGGALCGKQLVPQSWVRESTAEHSRWDAENLGYGYLWWLPEGDEGCFAAVGDGGNIIYVNPRKRLSVAISSVFKPRVFDRIELIKREIEPVFS